MDAAYSDAKCLSENEFKRLEKSISSMAPVPPKLPCPRQIEDTATCYLVNSSASLECTHLTNKFQLCVDTVMNETTKRRYRDSLRKDRKPC